MALKRDAIWAYVAEAFALLFTVFYISAIDNLNVQIKRI